MRDLLAWNVSLGRWKGVHVRIHVFFLLFAIIILHYSAQAGIGWYGFLTLGILFASALAHELGHCYAAVTVGGSADQVLLWPFGGLAHVNVSQDPQAELVTALAGPITNLAACVLLMIPLVGLRSDLLPLVNPLMPPIPAGGIDWEVALRTAFWVNWLLLIVNLLPAFPLDGGRALRALLWPRKGYRTSVLLVVRAAKMTALLLCLAAWLVRNDFSYALLPLLIFAVFIYFCAKQEAERLSDQEPSDAVFGYDFSQGYTSLERHLEPPAPQPGPLTRWLSARKAARLERQRKLEEDEERRVDEILVRLHEVGMSGLSEEERALLSRVSARYRNRQQG